MAKKGNANDNTILGLKKQIEDKKKALRGIERFVPKTNCSLQLYGERINLHAASKTALTLAMLNLASLIKAAEDMNVLDTFKLDGFTLSEWFSDVSSKLLIMDKQQEEARLKALEAKLTELLSDEKKTELIIDELKDLI